MKWKLGNQLALFRSSASGLADVRSLAAGQVRIPRALPQLAKKNAGHAYMPEVPLPASRYTRRAWQCICLQFELTAQLASADVNSARLAATAHMPTAVAGTCMCVRQWACTPPCAYGDVGVTRSVKRFVFLSMEICN